MRLRSRGLTFLSVTVLMLGANSLAGVTATNKSLKDATHIELSGLNEWRYDIHRDKEGGKNIITIQLIGVLPSEVKGLEKISDGRVTKVDVTEGINGDASIKLTLISAQMNLFDYQTESPTSLVLDVFKDEPAKAKTSKAAKAAQAPSLKDKGLAEFVAPAKKSNKAASKIATQLPAKITNRKVASDYVAVNGSGSTSPTDKMIGGDSNGSIELKYGIFDGGDQDLKRFKLDDSQMSELALLKSQEDIYLHFPALKFERPYLKMIQDDAPKYDVGESNTEENQQIRLVLKLVDEEKYAVALKTMKFFTDKFPKTQYQRVLDFVTADIYYKLWMRDHERTDLETSIARYKELLTKYPNDPLARRTTMLVGLTYASLGNNLGALSMFQTAVKDDPKSPYIWVMRLFIGDALSALNKDGAALAEFKSIESDPASKDFGIEAKYRSGDVYFRAGKYREAISEYQESLKKYADKWQEGPNLYFNAAESNFWLKDYKASIDNFREFLQRFPSHPYGGYAMTRMGEILEITGAPFRKYNGAYLESNFRYRGTPGAFIARVHINHNRFSEMKPAEVEAFLKETDEQITTLKMTDLDVFVKLNLTDGFSSVNDFQKSLDLLVKYYQENPLSPYLSIFKHRIVGNLSAQVADLDNKKEYMKALELYMKNQETWLQKNNRVDVRYAAGRAYDALNLNDEAEKQYKEALKIYTTASPEELKKKQVFEKLPTTDAINLRLARVYLRMDDIKKVTSFLDAIKSPALLTSDDKIERALIISALAEKEEKLDMAIAALKDLNDSWKGNANLLAEPWYGIARINKVTKNYDEALKWLRKVIDASNGKDVSINPDLMRNVLDMSGDLNVLQGHFGQAEKDYKLYLEKYSDGQPSAPVKYKLGKLYFDQKNLNEASRVWTSLKDDSDGQLWSKMANEQLTQARWGAKYNKYLDRKPAGGNK